MDRRLFLRAFTCVLAMVCLLCACSPSDGGESSGAPSPTDSSAVTTGDATTGSSTDEQTKHTTATTVTGAVTGTTSGSRPSSVTTTTAPAGAETESGLAENKKKGIYPMFSNIIDRTRPGVADNSKEAYIDYSDIAAKRHTFEDMLHHSAEVAAVRLAEKGVFEKTAKFRPDQTVTVAEFMTYLFQLSGFKAEQYKGNLLAFAQKSLLVQEGVITDVNKELNKEQMAYLLDRAVLNCGNAAQYAMAISDYATINAKMKASVLQCVALGLVETTGTFQPQSKVTRAVAAEVLYRLVNTGARLVPDYDIGNIYKEGQTTYLVKSEQTKNPSGIQFGMYTNYNYQNQAFEAFGKLPIDRVDFHKWVNIEKTQGTYKMPSFANEKYAHGMGSTVITNVDISANLVWNPGFDKSNIPSFYPQDITDPTTRAAAKKFLYAFVQEMLKEIGGDVILAIDYELDWQQNISGEFGAKRAAIFGDWFVEACEVARKAAKDMGMAEHLKLIVIYNNITTLHKLGPDKNEWMLKIAKAVDYVGIDAYAYGYKQDDNADSTYVLESFRFLIHNYSLGKPVIMVENGAYFSANPNEIDKTTGLTSEATSGKYFDNLFREFRFACERGDFLNANIEGYLVWSFKPTGALTSMGRNYGLLSEEGKFYATGIAVKKGIESMQRQQQFRASYQTGVANVGMGNEVTLSVESGTTYDHLTYLTTDRKAGDPQKLQITLQKIGTVFIEVNGEVCYSSRSMKKKHTFTIDSGLKEGFNQINIYFGSEKTPFTRTVTSLEWIA